MRHLTALALGLLLLACNRNDRAGAGDDLESARANADTAVTGAVGAAGEAVNEVDTALAGDTSMGAPASTAEARPTTPLSPGANAGAPAGEAKADLSGLTGDQVRQLQAALNDNGCNAGPVDGIVGPQTQQGVACGLQKQGLQGGDLNALYRSLNLDFGG